MSLRFAIFQRVGDPFEMAPVDHLGELETAPKNAPLRACYGAADDMPATLWLPGVLAPDLTQPDVVTDLEFVTFHFAGPHKRRICCTARPMRVQS
jgi:hypothetical protein